MTGPRFEAFYAAYPDGRKVRARAERAWLHAERRGVIPPADESGDPVLKAIDWWRRHPDWTKSDGEFIPGPAPFVNDQMWTTALEALGKTAAQPGPAQPPTPTRPSWAIDVTAAIGNLGTKLYYALQDAYPRWPRHGETDPECLRLEALWSAFVDEKDIDKILSLRPAIEAEIAKLEGRDEAGEIVGRHGKSDACSLAGGRGESGSGPGRTPSAQASLDWRAGVGSGDPGRGGASETSGRNLGEEDWRAAPS